MTDTVFGSNIESICDSLKSAVEQSLKHSCLIDVDIDWNGREFALADLGCVFDLSGRLYNQDLMGHTNVIHLDCNEFNSSNESEMPYMLSQLMAAKLKNRFEEVGRILMGTHCISGGASIALNIFDPFSFSELIGNELIEELGQTAIEKALDIGIEGVSAQLSAARGKLYLSTESLLRLRAMIKNAQESDQKRKVGREIHFPAELLLSSSLPDEKNLGAKLLVITSPHLLDPLTLVMIHWVISQLKNTKIGQLPRLSFLFIHSDPMQPPLKAAYERLKLFAMRHGMYETAKTFLPFPLITPGAFVGRNDELSALKSSSEMFLNKGSQSKRAILIEGEPGMGKTSLYQRHWDDLLASDLDSKRLHPARVLRLHLNFDSQTSSDSGLATLTQALLNEAERLDGIFLLKEMFKKTLDYVPVLSGVKKIFEGVSLKNKAKDMAGALGVQIEKIQGDELTEQFNTYVSAINLLLSCTSRALGLQGSKNNRKVELFLDDLQWLDERTAEFVMTRLLSPRHGDGLPVVEAGGGVRVVATVRGSDMDVSRSQWKNSGEVGKYRCLFDDWLKNETQVEIIRLTCLEQKHIADLLLGCLSIGESQILAEELANGVREFLADDGSNDPNINQTHVPTLFVVEALNLLADKRITESLKADEKIEPLFAREEGTNLPRFAMSTKEDLRARLDVMFEVLRKEYGASFNSLAGVQGQGRFTLGSFAVMEERLQLVQHYLGEVHGKLASHFIVMSHLGGKPFNTELMKEFLEAFATYIPKDESGHEDIEGQKLLIPLIKDFSCALDTQIVARDLDALESVFQLIRAADVINRYKSYAHSHALVKTYVGMAFARLINQYASEVKPATCEKIERMVRSCFNDLVLLTIRNKYHDGFFSENGIASTSTDFAKLSSMWNKARMSAQTNQNNKEYSWFADYENEVQVCGGHITYEDLDLDDAFSDTYRNKYLTIMSTEKLQGLLYLLEVLRENLISLGKLSPNMHFEPSVGDVSYLIRDCYAELAGHGFMSSDPDTSISNYLIPAQNGDRDAQAQLAYIYRSRVDGKDCASSFYWYREAAKRGCVDSIFEMGRMLENGEGCDVNLSGAVVLYKRAADREHHPAIHAIGRLFYLGYGVRQDDLIAFNLFKVGAEAGNVDAMFMLGTMYLDRRVPSPEKILLEVGITSEVEWLREAAQRGHSTAAEYIRDYEDRCRS